MTPEEKKEKRHQYYLENKEKEQSAMKAWRAAHPGYGLKGKKSDLSGLTVEEKAARKKAYMREYYHNNKEKFKTATEPKDIRNKKKYCKDYYQANKEKFSRNAATPGTKKFEDLMRKINGFY